MKKNWLNFEEENLLTIYLAILLLVGSLFIGKPMNFLVSLAVISIYVGVQIIINFYKIKKWILSFQNINTALIFVLIFDIQRHLYLVFLTIIISLAIECFFKYKKILHSVNPLILSLLFVSIFVPVASWWGVSWSPNLFLVITIPIGIYFLKKWRQLRLIGLIGLSWLILVITIKLWQGNTLSELGLFFLASIFDPVFIFFMSIVCPYYLPNNLVVKHRNASAVFVGFAIFIFTTYWFKSLRFIDPLLLAMTAGNMLIDLRYRAFKEDKI